MMCDYGLHEALAASLATAAQEQSARHAERRQQEADDQALAEQLQREDSGDFFDRSRSPRTCNADEPAEGDVIPGFKEVQMPQDGNCLYHAVMQGIPLENRLAGHDTFHVDDVRRAIARWVADQEKRRALTQSEEDARRKAAGGIGCAVVDSEYWGGDDELEVLSAQLNAKFVVFEEVLFALGLREPVVVGMGGAFTIHLVNYGNVHFNLLIPRGD